MNWKIDWLSIVIPAPEWGDVPVFGMRDAALTATADFFGDAALGVMGGFDWAIEGGRAPFNLSLLRSGGGMRLFFSHHLTTMLLEITGVGCTRLAEDTDILSISKRFKAAISRLDVAVDFETDIRPAEFAVLRSVERFKAHGEVVSATGETYYVGSLKSERFARVYRYNEPHPRSHLLRVEHVFRKESAKLAIEYLESHSVIEWIGAIGAIFGWKHALWETDARIGQMSARVVERPEEGKTVFWMYNTVAPCLARLLTENRITLEEFLGAVSKAMRHDEPDEIASPSQEVS